MEEVRSDSEAEEPPSTLSTTSDYSMYAQPSKIKDVIAELKEKHALSDLQCMEIERVNEIYPMKINPYYLGLIKARDDPIWKMCIPSIKELTDQVGEEDPLCEERDSPAPLITHRYPDRLLMLISESCDMFCRFCTRKRKMGTPKLFITYEKIDKGCDYIEKHTEVRDVILSGGDALCAPIERLEYVLDRLCRIEHVEIIRLGTRVPAVNPSRITPELVTRIAKYGDMKPIYINVHFEHPRELTPEAKQACTLLAKGGFPLGNQNVLLKDVNDDPCTMGALYKGLLQFKVKPYYLFQADYVLGTNHFRTPVKVGLDIIQNIRGFISGLAIPDYVIDLPDGGGKVPLIPNYLQSITDEKVVMANYKGRKIEYPQPR